MTWTCPTSECRLCSFCHVALSSSPCCCGRDNEAWGKLGSNLDIISVCGTKNHTLIYLHTYMLDSLSVYFWDNSLVMIHTIRGLIGAYIYVVTYLVGLVLIMHLALVLFALLFYVFW